MPPPTILRSRITRRFGAGAARAALGAGLVFGVAALLFGMLEFETDPLALAQPLLSLFAWGFAGVFAARLVPDFWLVAAIAVMLPPLLVLLATAGSFSEDPLGPVPAMCEMLHVAVLATGGAGMVHGRWRARLRATADGAPPDARRSRAS